MRYWVQLATEQFPPSALVRQAQEAEQAGFDALNVSDHLQPWWEPGESGHAWALLGAIGPAAWTGRRCPSRWSAWTRRLTSSTGCSTASASITTAASTARRRRTCTRA